MTRIGILGGSFDPVHRGHLAAASYALSELNLGRVYFVPSHRTPLREKKALLPASLRLALLRRALKGKRGLSLSEIELKRKGVSYTVDTLRAFKKKFGRRAQLFFLAGADHARDFSRWKSPSEVLKLCRFVVMTRPGSRLKNSDPRFLVLPMPPVPVSSSDIRKRLRRGQSVAAWVPPGGARLLDEHFRKGKAPSRPRKKSA